MRKLVWQGEVQGILYRVILKVENENDVFASVEQCTTDAMGDNAWVQAYEPTWGVLSLCISDLSRMAGKL